MLLFCWVCCWGKTGATDAARAAADIVLTQPGLSAIVEAIVVARTIFRRMKNFVTYRIAATLQLLIFFFIAVLAFPPPDYQPDKEHREKVLREEGDWPNFFNVPVLMLMLITLLNDGTMIAIGYDRVIPAHLPDSWNLPMLFAVSSVLALVALGSSLFLLWCGLDSWSEDGVFQSIGLGGLTYGQIVTMMYLKVAVSDFLTMFSARTYDKFFWQSAPSPILLFAASIALVSSTIIASTWPKSRPDGVPVLGLAYRPPQVLPLWIWIYCLVWWLIQDAAKVVFIRAAFKYNWFGVRNKTTVDHRNARVGQAAAREEVKGTDKV
jgi:H+-transporting ATPase